MSAARYRQEYEIDYDAHQGEKAFPEMQTRREEIVQREGPYIDGVWPIHLPMWGGFDYGSRNPSSFHVYTVVDGVIWAIWEMYGPCRNILDFVQSMKACPYWNQIRYIVHDPDMGNLKQRDMKTGEVISVRSQFERLGVTRWLPGNNDEAAWLLQMQKHWCGEEVTFRILSSCPHLIEEFEGATYRNMTDRQLETQNYIEQLVDKRNHSLDDCKYFMNSTAQRSSPRPIRLPSLVAGYGWSGSSRSTGVAGRQRELGMVL